MVNNPPGNNPQSGSAIARGGIQQTVPFDVEFGTKPNVVLSPWGNYHVWLATVTVARFKFQNDSDGDVKVDWIADEF